jgi:hypothetical protein
MDVGVSQNCSWHLDLAFLQNRTGMMKIDHRIRPLGHQWHEGANEGELFFSFWRERIEFPQNRPINMHFWSVCPLP